MTEQHVGVAIGITAPVWMAVLFYYVCRVCHWLDGKPWSATK